MAGRFTSQRGRERVYNGKVSKATALRGGSGVYLFIARFWLEQIVNSSGNLELSQAGILRWGQGYNPRDMALSC